VLIGVPQFAAIVRVGRLSDWLGPYASSLRGDELNSLDGVEPEHGPLGTPFNCRSGVPNGDRGKVEPAVGGVFRLGRITRVGRAFRREPWQVSV
jgi:hypothetical protein